MDAHFFVCRYRRDSIESIPADRFFAILTDSLRLLYIAPDRDRFTQESARADLQMSRRRFDLAWSFARDMEWIASTPSGTTKTDYGRALTDLA